MVVRRASLMSDRADNPVDAASSRRNTTQIARATRS
jgi:hypothetical protein